MNVAFSHIFLRKVDLCICLQQRWVIFLAKFMALENPTNGIPFLIWRISLLTGVDGA